MLGKVMKYHGLSLGRQLLPYWGLSVAAMVLLRLLAAALSLLPPPLNGMLPAITSVLGMLLLVALFVVTLVMVIIRFAKSMLGDEAYLTFSLPVKATTHITARLLVDLGYLLASVGLAVLCGRFLLVDASFEMELGGMTVMRYSGPSSQELSEVALGGGSLVSVILLVVASVVLALMLSQLQIYAAMGIGAGNGKNAAGISVVSYFVINAAEGVLSLVLFAIGGSVMIGSEGGIFSFLTRLDAMSDAELLSLMLGAMWSLMGMIAVATLIFCVINYLIACNCFEKRLNLG